MAGAALFLSNQVLGWTSLHFLYVAPLLTVLSTTLHIVGSLAGPPPPAESVEGLVWAGAWPGDGAAPRYARFGWQAAALLVVTVVLVITFA